MNTIKQQSGTPSANATGNFECKPMYFQRAPFAPPKLNTIPTNVFDTIDPLDWVSLPDLFFGENYQNMLPTLESGAPDNCTSVFSPDPNLQPQGQGRPYMQRYEICDTVTQQEISRLQSFPPEKVNDFKHVIYNLLVDNYNNPQKNSFVQPCTIEENGVIRQGFCFNENDNPEKKLPELYAQHIRKARLDQEDISSVFVHDLYKFYLRASVELLSKYFEKRDKYTYLYEDVPLFIPNGTLEQAEERIRNMKTRARKKRKILPS